MHLLLSIGLFPSATQHQLRKRQLNQDLNLGSLDYHSSECWPRGNKVVVLSSSGFCPVSPSSPFRTCQVKVKGCAFILERRSCPKCLPAQHSCMGLQHHGSARMTPAGTGHQPPFSYMFISRISLVLLTPEGRDSHELLVSQIEGVW